MKGQRSLRHPAAEKATPFHQDYCCYKAGVYDFWHDLSCKQTLRQMRPNVKSTKASTLGLNFFLFFLENALLLTNFFLSFLFFLVQLTCCKIFHFNPKVLREFAIYLEPAVLVGIIVIWIIRRLDCEATAKRQTVLQLTACITKDNVVYIQVYVSNKLAIIFHKNYTTTYSL